MYKDATAFKQMAPLMYRTNKQTGSISKPPSLGVDSGKGWLFYLEWQLRSANSVDFIAFEVWWRNFELSLKCIEGDAMSISSFYVPCSSFRPRSQHGRVFAKLWEDAARRFLVSVSFILHIKTVLSSLANHGTDAFHPSHQKPPAILSSLNSFRHRSWNECSFGSGLGNMKWSAFDMDVFALRHVTSMAWVSSDCTVEALEWIGMVVGVFPKIGVPPQIINFNRVFHYKPLETPLWSRGENCPMDRWLNH